MSEKPMNEMNPWEKIMRCAKRGIGLRLTSEEVWKLSNDDAIAACANQDRVEDSNADG